MRLKSLGGVAQLGQAVPACSDIERSPGTGGPRRIASADGESLLPLDRLDICSYTPVTESGPRAACPRAGLQTIALATRRSRRPGPLSSTVTPMVSRT